MMERKSLAAEIKQLNERGEGTARIATLNTRDRDGDVLQSGCCGEQTVPLLVAHQWDRVPVGKARVYEGPGAMLADFKINMGLGRGKELHSALRFDLDNPPPRAEWSFGFRIPEGGAERGMFQGQPVRFLKRFEVLEISPVVAGAGIATATLSLKAAQDQEALAAIEARVRAMTLKEGIPDTAAIVASIQQTLRLGAERLAKMENLVPFRYIDMTGFTLLDPRRHLAREVVFHAAKELAVTVPNIRFFTTCDEDRAEFMDTPMWGYARKNEIGVEWSLSPDEMVQVVSHEVAHFAGLDEEKADKFGKSFAARYGTQFGTAPRPRVDPFALAQAARSAGLI